jgi:hypothetical protein
MQFDQLKRREFITLLGGAAAAWPLAARAPVLPGQPADFGKLIAGETEKWVNVIRAANIKSE